MVKSEEINIHKIVRNWWDCKNYIEIFSSSSNFLESSSSNFLEKSKNHILILINTSRIKNLKLNTFLI